MDLAAHFKGLLSRIEPDAEYVAAARSAHETVREQLRDDDDVGQAHLETFLSGSYRRSTAIRTIKDVDVTCVVDIDRQITEPNWAIAWLQAALQKYYDNVRRQPRSVRVITKDDVKLDVVPATPETRNDTEGPLWIPDREAGSWVPSHPKGQIAFAQERNKDTEGYYIQTIKLTKHWRDRQTPATSRPKSYIVECLVAGALGSLPPGSHAEAVAKVLGGILSQYGRFRSSARVPEIADPGYPYVNVTKRWLPDEFDAFMDHVEAADEIASAAFSSTDEDESVRLWRSLLGSDFLPAA